MVSWKTGWQKVHHLVQHDFCKRIQPIQWVNIFEALLQHQWLWPFYDQIYPWIYWDHMHILSVLLEASLLQREDLAKKKWILPLIRGRPWKQWSPDWRRRSWIGFLEKSENSKKRLRRYPVTSTHLSNRFRVPDYSDWPSWCRKGWCIQANQRLNESDEPCHQ